MSVPFLLDYNYITTKILLKRNGGKKGLCFRFDIHERKLLRLKAGAMVRITLRDYTTDYEINLNKTVASSGKAGYLIYFNISEVLDNHLQEGPYKIKIQYLGMPKKVEPVVEAKPLTPYQLGYKSPPINRTMQQTTNHIYKQNPPQYRNG